MDVYKLNELKFYHKYINNNLPQYFQILPLNPNNTVRGHNMRHKDNIHIRRTNHEFAKKCIRYATPVLINSVEPEIKYKCITHSLQGFTKYVKNKLIHNYVQN